MSVQKSPLRHCGVLQKACCVMLLAVGSVHANPLMGLAAINGVVDAVKRTADGVKAVTDVSKTTKPASPKIALSGANRIEPTMVRDDVLALLGMPTQTERTGGPSGPLRDVYLVKREGPCSQDRVEIGYLSDQSRVQDIRQRCGDVTSNENRQVWYFYSMELPAVFDQVSEAMPRDKLLDLLGQPSDTRDAPGQREFVDTYLFEGQEAKLVYRKGHKLLVSVSWNGKSVKVPRIRRADLFEVSAGN